ncbi:phosphoglycerate kinase [Candidatus Beckwithbacteria bacterium CG23_combo_of_CG06-09_8_20_14_all_34_8]|uniref:Phosphoglycerate kinase n=1 Tax=Candidatus Beckwithbacteria bacterium CG23_combo_of_CG06-09_8_20_14_all_34_8 TaxID=1974497 RepID=A0A2H0B5T6_9BACT|nr:MAG: phosphoglycerate kinase [Candidatus Beckwithbacteria bacterium CG23_combo_of_CG06-09_8_20_14_all_34_8]
MNKKTILDINLTAKSVVIRVDYNVSLVKKESEYEVSGDVRIRESLKTINYILKQKPSRLVILSHLGRPEGKVDLKYSLEPVAHKLSELINIPVEFIKTTPNKSLVEEIKNKNNGEIIMLENLRFYPQEEKNDIEFSHILADLGDVYVNEAFSNCHRAHASIVGVSQYLSVVAGLGLEKEISMITKATESPEAPLVVIIGGAKATTKIPILEKLFVKADYVLLGGGVANTFLKALGFGIGQSIYSPESMRLCQNLIWKATRAKTRLLLPSDLVVGRFETGISAGIVDKEKIPLQMQALDIGPKTTSDYSEIIAQAKTIIWNGPMGAIEKPAFVGGNNAILHSVASNSGAVSVVGGGETLSAIELNEDIKHISHVSTGGGAMLELIEKDTLPGLEVLANK